MHTNSDRAVIFALTEAERSLRDRIIERHAGKQDLGLNHDWPLEELFDRCLPPTPDGEVALNRLFEARRVITVAVASAGCLARGSAASNALSTAWIIDNSPQRHVPAAEWLAAFDAAGYVSDDSASSDPPTEPKVLWRGAVDESKYGLAWTEQRHIAQGVADFWTSEGFQGTVYRAEVAADRVKARFFDKQEFEWVVDPRGLKLTIDREHA